MFKIGVIGEKDVIMGFKGMGLDTYPVSTVTEGLTTLEKVCLDKNTSLILITETMVQNSLQQLTELRERTDKNILIIPTHKKSSYLSLKEIKASIEKAVGIDLISKEE